MRISKVFTFDAGHRLTKHKGKCYNLHGHTYKLEVLVDGPLNENDMVMDFSLLKNAVNSIIDEYDHAMILNIKDFNIIQLCEQHGYRQVLLNGDPTAELIVTDIYKKLVPMINDRLIIIHGIRLWETPTSYAEVMPYDKY